MAQKKLTEEIILKVKVDSTQADDSLKKLKKKIPPIEKGVNKLKSSIKGMGAESAKASKQTGLLGTSLKQLASGAAAGLVIAKLKQLGSEAIKVSREFERIGLAMNTVFGAGAAGYESQR